MKYLSANNYYRQRYGKKMYKASISLATSCPNRDGTCGYEGCAFCSGEGSGEFATKQDQDILSQIDNAIEKVSSKIDDNTGFIAYFQSFTTTYVSPKVLRLALKDAMNHPRIESIAIATRPDCLDEEVMTIISEINKQIPVSVELGLQTISDEVAADFGRGYKTSVYDEAVRLLHNEGIEVITHVIFGLPGETVDDMMATIKHCVEVGTDGFKFTCLYLLEGTRYGQRWKQGDIVPLEMEEYFDIVEKALEFIPFEIPILRVTGDGPKKILLAPMWTANKRQVVNYINRRFA